MTQSGESLIEEPRLSKGLLSLRRTSRIGTWNVRTMYQTGKTKEVVDEFEKNNLDILATQEIRWTGFGKITTQEKTIIYSGHTEETRHTEGVALILSKKASKAMIAWEPAGPRMITATFRTNKKDINLHVINCYAPTNEREEEDKHRFYENLQRTLDKRRRKDITLLLGDFNAKIGSDNTGLEETMGTNGMGKMNENGELFTDLCANNSLVIGGSIFSHKEIHKATWISPNYHTGAANQIDHICINKRFRSSLQDVKVFRGADVGSDHHLVISKIHLKLRKGKFAANQQPKFNVTSLRDPQKREEYAVAVKNRFSALGNLDETKDVEDHWESIKGIWKDCCEEVLGRREKQNKEWITKETLEKIADRKTAKATLNSSKTRASMMKAQRKYAEKDKLVKRSARSDKRKYLDDMAQEAEQAAVKGNLREVYCITKKLTGKFRTSDMPIKDKTGNLITNQEDQKKRWMNHFEELLNRPPPENPPQIDPASEDLDIETEPPSREEIEEAIKKLKNNKAAGPDGIPGEAVKNSIGSATDILHELFKKIWETESFPQDWKEGHIVKLPKKGNLQECNNYRGITLLSIVGKVFNRVILERLKEGLDTKLRDEQAGFRKGKSCADQIGVLRIIVEQSLEWKSPLYINFIDFEKAFDSVDRETLWKLLRKHGVPKKSQT